MTKDRVLFFLSPFHSLSASCSSSSVLSIQYKYNIIKSIFQTRLHSTKDKSMFQILTNTFSLVSATADKFIIINAGFIVAFSSITSFRFRPSLSLSLCFSIFVALLFRFVSQSLSLNRFIVFIQIYFYCLGPYSYSRLELVFKRDQTSLPV